jgi:hypothetical protein
MFLPSGIFHVSAEWLFKKVEFNLFLADGAVHVKKEISGY